MPKRTLSSCWKQYEKLADDFLDAESDAKRQAVMAKIVALTERANRDQIGAALETLFVKPFIQSPVGVRFFAEVDGAPEWATRFLEDEAAILVHPVAVSAFIRKARATSVSEGDFEDFLACRYKSFLVELAKLPSIYVLFLVVLQQVAYLLQIAHLEKRGGVVEVAEGESYHTLLWGFKELEAFARRAYGVNVRAHYGISWYEAEWITGR